MLDHLLARFRHGDRLALSRLLTLVARGHHIGAILAQVVPPPRPGRVIALTGSGGVGKSTLIGKLVECARDAGQRVAVLACDPQSPLSGGALLGDRFRMPSRPDDDGVFIRSLAAPGGQGAVAPHVGAMSWLLETFGFDLVFLETVGAGQGDTLVHSLSDMVILLLQAETGDELQWEKAGLLEVADLIVIHKADLPGSERVEAQVKAALHLSANREVPVLRVSAKTGEGLESLWKQIASAPHRRTAGSIGGKELLRLAQEILALRFETAEAARDEDLARLMERWQKGNVDLDVAASELLRLLGNKSASTPRG